MSVGVCVCLLVIIIVFLSCLIVLLSDKVKNCCNRKEVVAKVVDFKCIDNKYSTYYCPILEYTIDNATYQNEYSGIRLSESTLKTFNRDKEIRIWVDEEDCNNFRRVSHYSDGLMDGIYFGSMIAASSVLLFLLLGTISPIFQGNLPV